jgi:hypothetical protein
MDTETKDYFLTSRDICPMRALANHVYFSTLGLNPLGISIVVVTSAFIGGVPVAIH